MHPTSLDITDCVESCSTIVIEEAVVLGNSKHSALPNEFLHKLKTNMELRSASSVKNIKSCYCF
jgi:hypothetical protein